MNSRAARKCVLAGRIFAAIPICVTLLPLWRTARGWVRIWDFPRAQIAGLGLLAEALLWTCVKPGAKDRLLAFGVTSSLLYQFTKILPYTPLYRRQVRTANSSPERRIRLLMSNVYQDNRRSDLVLERVRESDPDIVCLVETDRQWERGVRTLERDYPWSARCVLANTYGMILYSRLPLENPQVRFLVKPGVPSIKATVKLRSGDKVTLYAVHPEPPLPCRPSYGRDAELVLVGREIDRERKPAIVIGDLNDVAWSYTTTLFQRLSHTLDPRVGRGMFNTFHARHPLARYPLDHVFHTREFTYVDLRRLGYTGSDHFPILAELAFEPSRRSSAPRPETDQSDRDHAQEILRDADRAGPAPEQG